MSFNRRRNIFTLGDFVNQQHPQHQLKIQNQARRQNSDIFQRDPFKIQSYNFRYADKPTFPLENLVKRCNNQHSTSKRFETYFYNYDFTPAGRDKENPAPNQFHEHRRRKFVQQQQQQQPAQQPRQLFELTKQYGKRKAGEACGWGKSRESESSVYPSSYENAIPTTSPLLRRGCHREYLQGLCPVHTSSTQIAGQPLSKQQKQQQQLQKVYQSSSQMHNVFKRNNNGPSGSRRLYPENGRNDSSSSHTNALGGARSTSALRQQTNHNQQFSHQSPRACNSTTSQRRQLQALHVPSKDMVDCKSISHSLNASSGCQININIKSNNDNQNSENVTIQIETDGGQITRQGASASCTHVMHPSSPNNNNNFNLTGASSSNTFVINKHISKFAIKKPCDFSPDSNSNAVPRSKLDSPYATAQIFPVKKPADDRLPTLIPWNAQTKCYAPVTGTTDATTRDKFNQRRLNALFSGKTPNLKNLKTHAPDLPGSPQAFKPNTEHKLLNTVSSFTRRTGSMIMLNNMANNLRSSRHSLHSNVENNSNVINMAGYNVNNGSRIIRSRSRSPLVYASRSNLSKGSKSPVNVNINVYADKLKLLRV